MTTPPPQESAATWQEDALARAQDKARARLRQIAAARADEAQAVVDALRAGVRQVDIAADLGRTREHVRKLTREAGGWVNADIPAPDHSKGETR